MQTEVKIFIIHNSLAVLLSPAFKGCQGIVFTNGVRMGGRVVGKVYLGCLSETVRCRKFILGRDIG